MSTIEIICKNTGIRKEYPLGIRLKEIAEDQNIYLESEIIACKVNNRIREISFELFKPKTIEFITVNDIEGNRMRIRSIFFLLFKAIKDLYPKANLHVEHSLPLGMYCEIHDLGFPLSEEHLQKIHERSKELISKDLPFIRKQIPTAEAIKIFEENGLSEKASLFETRNELYTSVYRLDNVANYFYGYLLPSTAYIKDFCIKKHLNGLMIIDPLKAKNQKLLSAEKIFKKQEESKLYKILQEHKSWLEILGIPYVGILNRAIVIGKSNELIQVSEALHEKKIASIADAIDEKKDCKIILISGPSSSGKTTFSKRLAVQLGVLGYRPLQISLDDYFLDRELTPRDAKGDYDFESIHAIDIPFFNEQLQKLLKGEEITPPTFDFIDGKRIFSGKRMKLEERSLLIIEGIHGLNPILSASIEEQYKYKIFVSALTHIAIDTQNPIQSTDNRLIRRIIRDFRYRGYSALDTLQRWQKVRNGEDQNIFPFQENADIMFNSALLFELSVLKNYAEPLLRAVPENCEEFIQARRLLKFFSYFHSIEDKYIPPTSILREFLGGSSFEY